MRFNEYMEIVSGKLYNDVFRIILDNFYLENKVLEPFLKKVLLLYHYECDRKGLDFGQSFRNLLEDINRGLKEFSIRLKKKINDIKNKRAKNQVELSNYIEIKIYNSGYYRFQIKLEFFELHLEPLEPFLKEVLMLYLYECNRKHLALPSIINKMSEEIEIKFPRFKEKLDPIIKGKSNNH